VSVWESIERERNSSIVEGRGVEDLRRERGVKKEKTLVKEEKVKVRRSGVAQGGDHQPKREYLLKKERGGEEGKREKKEIKL